MEAFHRRIPDVHGRNPDELVAALAAYSPATEASTLEEAIAKFPEAIKEAVDRLVEEAKEIRRREASRIVVPGGPLPGGGGMPGGGGIIGGGNV